MKQILQKPNLSGRMLKWVVELTSYDIEYQPELAIKGKALTNFIVEITWIEHLRKRTNDP